MSLPSLSSPSSSLSIICPGGSFKNLNLIACLFCLKLPSLYLQVEVQDHSHVIQDCVLISTYLLQQSPSSHSRLSNIPVVPSSGLCTHISPCPPKKKPTETWDSSLCTFMCTISCARNTSPPSPPSVSGWLTSDGLSNTWLSTIFFQPALLSLSHHHKYMFYLLPLRITWAFSTESCHLDPEFLGAREISLCPQHLKMWVYSQFIHSCNWVYSQLIHSYNCYHLVQIESFMILRLREE